MRNFVENIKADGYSGFKGAAIAGSIPIKQEIINEVIHRSIVLRSRGKIEHLQLAVKAHDRIVLTVKIARLPAQNLEFYIEKRRVDLAASPLIVIRLESRGFWGFISNTGIVEMLANVLAGVPGVWPPGVRIEGQTIEINVRSLLEQLKLNKLIPYIKFIEVEGQQGRLLVHFRLEVD